MLSYLERVCSETVTVDDARALKDAGVSKEAAEDGVFVAACFGQLVRVADTLGWEIPPAEGFQASASFLLKAGYVMPLASRASDS